jgi:hypothetical protein
MKLRNRDGYLFANIEGQQCPLDGAQTEDWASCMDTRWYGCGPDSREAGKES